MTRSDLLPEIFKLSDYDQLLIAEAIRNHLLGRLAPVDENEFKRELERRALDADLNPTDESPLSEVMQRLGSSK